jgi:hypothetical protein
MIKMPFNVRFAPEPQLILITLHGDIGDGDLMELSRAVRALPELAAGHAVLYDCSSVASVGVSQALIQQLGMGARQDTNPIAFIAPSPIAYGLARMYQIIAGGDDRIEIFEGESEAREWLKRS